MSTSSNVSRYLVHFVELHSQIGVELAFVGADSDAGLLPINSLLMDFEDANESEIPPELVGGVAIARVWLDRIFDQSGQFSEELILNFNEWHGWMGEALASWERDEAIPVIPSNWTSQAAAASAPAELRESEPAEVALPVSEEIPKFEEKAIILNLKDDAELLYEFHGESVELLQEIEQGVLILEENPRDSATINSIFRAFHTFKGGAGFLHLHALQDLAHDLESLLDEARQSKLQITSHVIDLILAGADVLKNYTNEIGAQLKGVHAGEPITVPTSQLILRVKAVLNGEAPILAPNPAKPAPVVAMPKVEVAKESVTETVLPEVMAAPALEPMAQVIAVEKAPAVEVAAKPVPSKRAAAAESSSGFIKLETWKLDALVDLVGELFIAQSMVVQDPDVQNLDSRTLARSLRQLSRTTTELQRNAMSLRMVPIRGVFQKMTRLVRDIGAAQQKEVQLILDGEETELDRNIVDKLGDPLVHMIRNAVDHGLESPSDRTAMGKSSLGTVRLSASHQRGGILIRIQDDGKGLDAAKILAKAIERGLVAQNAELTEAEIFDLIFMPGFSTAAAVTDLSGRGVGMDVVRRNIEGLRGKIEIQSALGAGSTFNILLPLTLAIIDGLMVGVGGERYIIPTISVRESFRPAPGMVSTIQERGELVMVRGKLTPLLRLGQFLGTIPKANTPEEGIIVVVESGDAMRAILVDELIGKQEVVIKSLGDTFQHQNLIAGAAVLGDGAVGLILDVDTIVKLCTT
jgi:two-component system chemotaxis sensor kinase CheA